MGWDRLPVLPTFERARRREIYRKLATVVKGEERPGELPSLSEVRRGMRLFEQRYVGIQPIPVANIVGTVDRRPDFAPGFLPKDFETRERWRRVEQAFPLGDFPPILVYQVEESYYVVDGHHRVAVAKIREIEYIDAEVTLLVSTSPLGADVNLGEAIRREQQLVFMQESGLAEARPAALIEFSRPLGYVELLDLVKVFGYHLMIDKKEVLSPEAIAGAWHDDVYLPAVASMRQVGLHESFPSATDADLFLWVYQRRQAFFPEHGGMTIEEAARRLKDA